MHHRALGLSGSGLAVHLAAMSDLEDLHDPPLVVYRVDDSVSALAYAIALRLASELLAAVWARRLGEALNPRDDSHADGAGLDGFEFPGS